MEMEVLFYSVKLVHSSFCKASKVLYSIDMYASSLAPFVR